VLTGRCIFVSAEINLVYLRAILEESPTAKVEDFSRTPSKGNLALQHNLLLRLSRGLIMPFKTTGLSKLKDKIEMNLIN